MESDLKYQSHQFNRYKYIIENIKDVIWEINKDFIFTFISPNAKSMFGYEVEELVGRRILDFLVEDSRNQILDLAAQHKRIGGNNKEIVLLVLQFICKNGSSIWVEISANPMFEQGELIGYIGTTRDITEKKKNESQLEK
ncbi:MAG: PAS domain S-box protein [Desulfosporosinus sp.]|jgi:PAS domain S-box-containing protein